MVFKKDEKRGKGCKKRIFASSPPLCDKSYITSETKKVHPLPRKAVV